MNRILTRLEICSGRSLARSGRLAFSPIGTFPVSAFWFMVHDLLLTACSLWLLCFQVHGLFRLFFLVLGVCLREFHRLGLGDLGVW